MTVPVAGGLGPEVSVAPLLFEVSVLPLVADTVASVVAPDVAAVLGAVLALVPGGAVVTGGGGYTQVVP